MIIFHISIFVSLGVALAPWRWRTWALGTACLALVATALGTLTAAAQVGCVPGTANYPCVYVTGGANTVSVINASTNQVIPNDVSLQLPTAVAITPDNNYVYVATGDATVAVIDTQANAGTATISGLSGFPSQIAVTPNGAFAYVVGTEDSGAFLDVIDTAPPYPLTNPLSVSRQGFTAVAFSPDGAFAYVAGTCGEETFDTACAYVIDTANPGNPTPTTVPISTTSVMMPFSIAVSPDGSLICMTVFTGDNLSTLAAAFIEVSGDTYTLLPLATIASSVAPAYNQVAVTPGGTLYVGYQSTLPNPPQAPSPAAYVVPITLSSQTIGNPIQVGNGFPLGTDQTPVAPSVAAGPGGVWMYATNAADNSVSVINATTDTVLPTTITVGNGPDAVVSMSLSPPTITTQPASQGVVPGQSATLSVAATNIAPLTYQWYQGQSGDTSAPIAGANSSSFATPGLKVAANYWVSVTNVAGTVDSSTAVVTVGQPPTCTLSIQGSAPPNFLTISAVANCADPQSRPLTTVITWGDDSSTTTAGGSVVTAHTYAAPGTYPVGVTAIDNLQLQGQAADSVDIPAATAQTLPPVFAGQSSDLTISIDGVPSGLQVTFECTTVTASNGAVYQATDLGLECSSNPSTVTFTGMEQAVAISIQTTGAATGSLAPAMRHRNILYAFLLPLPAFILLGIGAGTTRPRHCAASRWAALGIVMTILLFASCSGGFKVPTLVQGATPAGSYQVTVVDNSTVQPAPQGFVQTSLIVPLTVNGVVQ